MKKIIVVFMMLFLTAFTLKAEVLSVDPDATPKPIRITVEGLADVKSTSLTTLRDVFFKNELFRSNTVNSVAVIKKLADSKAMESEVIDAIITKLADMEDEMKKQQMVNAGMLTGLAVLIVLAVAVITRRRKK